MSKEKKIILTLVAVGVVLLIAVLLSVFGITSEKKDKVLKKKEPISQNILVENSEEKEMIEQDESNHSSSPENVIIQPSDENKDLARKKINEAAKSVPQNIAEAYKTIDACENISDKEESDRCIAAWARYELNELFCDKIKVTNKQDCYDSVFSLKAIAEKNISACLKVVNVGNRNSCIYRVIFESGVTSIDCGILSGEDNKTCRVFIETKDKKSAADCQSILDSEIKGICLDIFYYNLP